MQRFWEKVRFSELGYLGCIEWTAYLNSLGYGSFNCAFGGERRTRPAHRVAWMLVHGPIPEGLYVLHTCDNRKCVNPYHLYLGTQADNMLDMVQRNRHPGKIKTHCKHGHSLEDAFISKRGHRKCRPCTYLRKKSDSYIATRISRETSPEFRAKDREYRRALYALGQADWINNRKKKR